MSEGPCEHCDDSGYVERTTGGFWTGESMRTHQSICDCICGNDVRRELAVRAHLLSKEQKDGE